MLPGKRGMGNNLLISFLIFSSFISLSCHFEKNKYSSISEKNNYGDFPTLIDKNKPVDVSTLLINPSLSSFIISTTFKIFANHILTEGNSLNPQNKENHLKAIFIAINYLEVGERSFWKDEKKKIIGEIKIVRRFKVKQKNCVTYKEIISIKKKTNVDFTSACRYEKNWEIINA